MSLDNYTRVLYGWKVTGNKVHHIEQEIEKICEEEYHDDMYNIIDNCYIQDTMCGEYFYFGALIGSIDVYDSERGGKEEIIVNQKLIDESTKRYNDLIHKYPKLDKVFKKYSKNKDPQLYVMQNIW